MKPCALLKWAFLTSAYNKCIVSVRKSLLGTSLSVQANPEKQSKSMVINR